MPNLTIITYATDTSKDLSITEKSLKSQTYRDYEWILLNNNEAHHFPQTEYILFLPPGDYLTSKDTLQKVFEHPHSEDILFGNSYIKRPLRPNLIIGPKRDDVSIFHMMENPIPLSAAFLKQSLLCDRKTMSNLLEPTYWLEFFLSTFFLGNCTLKHIDHVVSFTSRESYKTMFNIDHTRQKEIIQTIMPRLVNGKNRLYSQSETNEALNLFYFLQRNKIAQKIYNTFLKPKGGLDA